MEFNTWVVIRLVLAVEITCQESKRNLTTSHVYVMSKVQPMELCRRYMVYFEVLSFQLTTLCNRYVIGTNKCYSYSLISSSSISPVSMKLHGHSNLPYKGLIYKPGLTTLRSNGFIWVLSLTVCLTLKKETSINRSPELPRKRSRGYHSVLDKYNIYSLNHWNQTISLAQQCHFSMTHRCQQFLK